MTWRTSGFLIASMLGATACALIAGIDTLTLPEVGDAGSPGDAGPDRRPGPLGDAADTGSAGNANGESGAADGAIDVSQDGEAVDATRDSSAVDANSDGGPRDARGDGSVVDASRDGPIDARDAGTGNGCPSGVGPSMVRVPSLDLKTYCVDSTEVTQFQYAQFLLSKNGNTSGQDPRCDWNNSYGVQCGPFDPGGLANYPVACVDWCDSMAYCAWAGKRLCGKIGGGSLRADPSSYDDPALSQKYSACSLQGTRQYPYGDSPDESRCIFQFRDAGSSLPVGSDPTCEGGYPGLFDMIGNLQEWEDSCDETDAGRSQGTCMVRGGDFRDDVWSCGQAYPTERSNAQDWIGFRCCAD